MASVGAVYRWWRVTALATVLLSSIATLRAETLPDSASADAETALSFFQGSSVSIESSAQMYVSIQVGAFANDDGSITAKKNNISISIQPDTDAQTTIYVNVPFARDEFGYGAKWDIDWPEKHIKAQLTFQQTKSHKFAWNQAVLDLTYRSSHRHILVTDQYYFGPYFRFCPIVTNAVHTDVRILAKFPAVEKIIVLASRQNWSKADESGNVRLRPADFSCQPQDNGEMWCRTEVTVGFGRQYEAMSALAAVPGVICVTQRQHGGGSYGEELRGIPLGTFFSSIDNVSFADVGSRVRQLLLTALPGQGGTISDAKQMGSQTSFVINALLPNRVAKFSNKNGYWYFIGMAFTVDFDDLTDGITENVLMSLNDVVEVKFPEDSSAPPPDEAVRNDGRSLLFMGPDNKLTDDGKQMIEWTVKVLSEMSRKTGGNVFSNSLDINKN
ncbi:hypothetical protein [Rhizobium leguminosarum]|uniref:hypothetical protein n=1 Tax=Rhizobium leguminosarum TaxID=384 RepID=UPI0014417BF0|nr:hypothetical protein [Rhizobium leguminosarum]NKL66281.1 hypothetical protein [Rhizobium leguminosarum bv. viciae]